MLFTIDLISINQALDAKNWEEEFSGKTTQQCWGMFQTLMNELIKEHVPMKKPNSKKRPI